MDERLQVTIACYAVAWQNVCSIVAFVMGFWLRLRALFLWHLCRHDCFGPDEPTQTDQCDPLTLLWSLMLFRHNSNIRPGPHEVRPLETDPAKSVHRCSISRQFSFFLATWGGAWCVVSGMHWTSQCWVLLLDCILSYGHSPAYVAKVCSQGFSI